MASILKTLNLCWTGIQLFYAIVQENNNEGLLANAQMVNGGRILLKIRVSGWQVRYVMSTQGGANYHCPNLNGKGVNHVKSNFRVKKQTSTSIFSTSIIIICIIYIYIYIWHQLYKSYMTLCYFLILGDPSFWNQNKQYVFAEALPSGLPQRTSGLVASQRLQHLSAVAWVDFSRDLVAKQLEFRIAAEDHGNACNLKWVKDVKRRYVKMWYGKIMQIEVVKRGCIEYIINNNRDR